MNPPRLRPEDIDLPYELRRCLDRYHQGPIVLTLDRFHKHESTYKGYRYDCIVCFNRKRRDNHIRRERRTGGTVSEGMKFSWFEITKDPQNLYKGLFRKYDFAVSFDSKEIWAAGTQVQDEKGQKFIVQYEPEAGLLRTDGVLFVLERKHLQFVAKEALA